MLGISADLCTQMNTIPASVIGSREATKLSPLNLQNLEKEMAAVVSSHYNLRWFIIH